MRQTESSSSSPSSLPTCGTCTTPAARFVRGHWKALCCDQPEKPSSHQRGTSGEGRAPSPSPSPSASAWAPSRSAALHFQQPCKLGSGLYSWPPAATGTGGGDPRARWPCWKARTASSHMCAECQEVAGRGASRDVTPRSHTSRSQKMGQWLGMRTPPSDAEAPPVARGFLRDCFHRRSLATALSRSMRRGSTTVHRMAAAPPGRGGAASAWPSQRHSGSQLASSRESWPLPPATSRTPPARLVR
mmetsp:Transcript_13127/g.47898  ORF Transcript_13127/g.47898 Transcript_13127/m.47898 type:complete len:245 (+) Transcript_13127:313-1047(+)